MTLFRIAHSSFEKVPETSFTAESILERRDLQRLLRADISVLDPDLMVVSEEFGEWQESSRRIDLLCLEKDTDGNGRLVVVELKRTEDGGHMELQAIRYAAMVSSMRFEQLVETHARHLGPAVDHATAAGRLRSFLDCADEQEPTLSADVRIVLVASNFSREITTAVLWLNKRELDITCVRLRPYRLGAEVLVDLQQLIPLPEAADYETKIKAQQQEERRARSARSEIYQRFWSQLIARSRDRSSLLTGRSTSGDHWLSCGVGRSGFDLNLVLRKDDSRVECFINPGADPAKSLAAFQQLNARREEIESTFGEPLQWEVSRAGGNYRVFKLLSQGWQTPESEWPAFQDSLLDVLGRLDRAIRPAIGSLTI